MQDQHTVSGCGRTSQITPQADIFLRPRRVSSPLDAIEGKGFFALWKRDNRPVTT